MGVTAMGFRNPHYFVETDWLHTHLDDADLRILDCTMYLPNYCDANAAKTIEVASGRAHWEQGRIPGRAFADLRKDLCDPANTRFRFPMPPAAQFPAAMSRYGVGEHIGGAGALRSGHVALPPPCSQTTRPRCARTRREPSRISPVDGS
jgi:3-mercaptopyruvate sulfurtransferase SseA